MLLVIITHAIAILDQEGLGVRRWGTFSGLLVSMRLPTFFLVSGLFARKSLYAPVLAFLDQRVLKFLYLYVLWSLAYCVGDLAIPLNTWTREVQEAVRLGSFLWYLVALPVFYAFARLMRSWPVALQIALGAVLFVLFEADILKTPSWGINHMGQCFVWFLVGLYGSEGIRKRAGSANWTLVVALGFLYFVVRGGSVALHGRGELAGNVVAPMIAIPFAICFAFQVAQTKPGLPLSSLGKTTLPVYVMHWGILELTVHALRATSLVRYPVTLLLPIVLTLTTTGIALGLFKLLKRVPVLFDLPPVLHWSVERRSASRAT